MSSRTQPTWFSDWWWSVDKVILGGLALLTVAGLVFLMAGGPPVAERLGLPVFHFVNKQAQHWPWRWCCSPRSPFLPPRHVRRLALLVFVGRWSVSGWPCSSGSRSRARAAGYRLPA